MAVFAALFLSGLPGAAQAETVPGTPAAKAFVERLREVHKSPAASAIYADLNADGNLDIIVRFARDCSARSCSHTIYVARRPNEWDEAGVIEGTQVLIVPAKTGGYRNVRLIAYYLVKGFGDRGIKGVVARVYRWSGSAYRFSHYRQKPRGKPVRIITALDGHCVVGPPAPMSERDSMLYPVIGRVRGAPVVLVRVGPRHASYFPAAKVRKCKS